MSVKYIPKGDTKIVIGNKTYQNIGDKKAVLPVDELGEETLEKLLINKFIVKLEFDESGNEKGDEKRNALLQTAEELGLTVTDDMTNKEIQKLIKEAR